MADESKTPANEAAPKKKGILPILIGLVLSIGLGAGGFFAAYSGMLNGLLGGSQNAAHAATDAHSTEIAEVAFVPIEPILISLPGGDTPRHLRFRAHIETIPAHQKAVADIMPRIMDVLNGYLRAVATEDLERPMALFRLRAQMLRRIRLVADQREIRDLLVTEFVLN
ncbi:flagellar basal body-associated FliL family protein [Aliiruegeria lutimaris]|uniref:Flagellar protein FliL n=1 Tax=Aliiruegeria lutimaris TaxID=571298 RepID=A0A1G8NP95_9RHOB|nr:flagellar basal body-associated FliL family protein [Aliiruegeria lutimaris]SDI81806.1 flagellar FliL protein [Aliiruegeria lutimaris]